MEHLLLTCFFYGGIIFTLCLYFLNKIEKYVFIILLSFSLCIILYDYVPFSYDPYFIQMQLVSYNIIFYSISPRQLSNLIYILYHSSVYTATHATLPHPTARNWTLGRRKELADQKYFLLPS